MCDERPGNAVDARQTGQVRVDQYGQIAEVPTGQTVVNLLDLGDDNVKVVEQPFSGRVDIDLSFLQADVAMCFAQYVDVLAQARKEGRRCNPDFCAVRLAETPAVLREACRAEYFRTDGRFYCPTRRIEKGNGFRTGVRHMPAQFARHGDRLGRKRRTDDDHCRHHGQHADEARRQKSIECFGKTPQAMGWAERK
jgi:hypothetical protein